MSVRPLLLAAALAIAFLATPARADAVSKAFWGPVTRDGVSQFPVYHDLGVGIYQASIDWSAVARSRPVDPRNPADPAYVWPADLDYAVAQAQLYHMRILLMLTYAPRWANHKQTREWAPRHPNDFADFAYAASLRYPSVHLWMIWGEPNRNFHPITRPRRYETTHLNKTEARAPHLYSRILDAAYGALKKRSRSNRVIGGNTFTGGFIRPLQWAANMKLPNGHRPRLDMYGHNPFTARRPDLSDPPSTQGMVDFSDLGRFNRGIDKRWGRHVPLFISELAWPTAPNDSEFNYYLKPRQQASWIKSAFKVAHEVHAYALGWVHLYDDPPHGNDPVSHGGLLDYKAHRKPGYKAFRRAR